MTFGISFSNKDKIIKYSEVSIMKNLKNRKKKGFTLIELVAVIAILAILAAVLVPSVSGYITRSRKTAIITQAREVVNAIEVYNLTSSSTKKISPSSNTKISDLNSSIEEIIGSNGADKIQSATVSDVYTINRNEHGDIIDRIELEDKDEKENVFKSLKKD